MSGKKNKKKDSHLDEQEDAFGGTYLGTDTSHAPEDHVGPSMEEILASLEDLLDGDDEGLLMASGGASLESPESGVERAEVELESVVDEKALAREGLAMGGGMKEAETAASMVSEPDEVPMDLDDEEPLDLSGMEVALSFMDEPAAEDPGAEAGDGHGHDHDHPHPHAGEADLDEAFESDEEFGAEVEGSEAVVEEPDADPDFEAGGDFEEEESASEAGLETDEVLEAEIEAVVDEVMASEPELAEEEGAGEPELADEAAEEESAPELAEEIAEEESAPELTEEIAEEESVSELAEEIAEEESAPELSEEIAEEEAAVEESEPELAEEEAVVEESETELAEEES
ncbi:MAG: hypothetical protein HQL86_08790, partial [Magnetococcales bacterium]|nr:hypothetical protein [Magnetococcales bacterium]